jgi:hypothetical protein
MPSKIDQAEMMIRKSSDSILESTKRALVQIREQSRVDTDKILKMETQMRLLYDTIDRLNALNHQMNHLTPLRLQMNETRAFIERQLPTMIHLQVAEGLHIGCMGIEKVREFE